MSTAPATSIERPAGAIPEVWGKGNGWIGYTVRSITSIEHMDAVVDHASEVLGVPVSALRIVQRNGVVRFERVEQAAG